MGMQIANFENGKIVVNQVSGREFEVVNDGKVVWGKPNPASNCDANWQAAMWEAERQVEQERSREFFVGEWQNM